MHLSIVSQSRCVRSLVRLHQTKYVVICQSGCRTLSYTATAPLHLAMKPGTKIPGLDIYKEKEAPIVLERSAYPEWLESLAIPLPSLAKLRRMPEEEATDKDKMRFLKLSRKLRIKKNNEEMKGKKRD